MVGGILNDSLHIPATHQLGNHVRLALVLSQVKHRNDVGVGAAWTLPESKATGKVHAARDVALEDGVAYVPAPHWQALTLALFVVAPAHDSPPGFAGKHPPALLPFRSLDWR